LVLRQIGVAHQETVALARGTAAFIDGPHNETLTAATVARGENALDARRVLLVLGFDVRARIRFDIDLLEQRLLRPKESHREQNKLGGAGLFRPGNFLRYELPFLVLVPLDLDRNELL